MQNVSEKDKSHGFATLDCIEKSDVETGLIMSLRSKDSRDIRCSLVSMELCSSTLNPQSLPAQGYLCF